MSSFVWRERLTRLENESILAFGRERFMKALVDSNANLSRSREGVLEQDRSANDILGAVQNFSPSVGVTSYTL